ncbi:MAG: protein-disulfide reductase DsbD domain-containing protein [Gemmatimonadales bacterium]|jgi:DsbC/DsbD-like thiol-disulfide interchange protein
MRRPAALISLSLLFAAPPVLAQTPEVGLVASPEYTAVRAGTAFGVAVQLRVPSGYHIYWVNPGAGGLPTTIAWQVSAGVSAGDTEWPYPESEDAGGGTANVYRGTLVLFSSFTAGGDVRGTTHLSATVTWGLCREQCVRQQRTLTVSIPVRGATGPRERAWNDLVLARRALPVRLRSGQVNVDAASDSVRLVILNVPGAPETGSWVTFFPFSTGAGSVVAAVRSVPGGIAVTLPRAVLTSASPARLSGVLVPAHSPGATPSSRPLLVDLAVTET